VTSDVLWQVAVEAPLAEALTYIAPKELQISRGDLVEVPLGSRRARGVALRQAKIKPEGFVLKKILAKVDGYPALPEPQLAWLEWLAKYYVYSPGLATSLAYPPLEKNAKKISQKKRPLVVPDLPRTIPHRLNSEQEKVVQDISSQPSFQAHLLYGVTGSGKTEVYLELLEKCVAQGLPGLVLVPEISLTPQLINRFVSRFGSTIATIHSHLTEREKTNQWWSMIEGQKKILIGARSALFCPLPKWGLIVVDEEHEPSYKQDEKLKYHARDAAVMLAKYHDCPIVLGSATPSLESWANAKTEKFKLHTIANRVANRKLPTINIVDLRKAADEGPRDKKIPSDLPFWISAELYLQIITTLGKKEQVALFLNRRGMAHVVLCSSCGHTKMCPNCDINLTLHADSHLICHYCDYHENLRTKCTNCSTGEFEKMGLGTELVEKDLRKLFPEACIARADRDEIQNRAELEQLIGEMETGKIDILIGTQMIAKGLDFPKLKLVGLLLADIGFNLPDFRATERSFQLITQMSGRSGRHTNENDLPGQVILQTYNTEHESLKYAIKHDFEGFAANELSSRDMLKYPPFGKLISFRIQSAKKNDAEQMAAKLAQRGKQLKEQNKNYDKIDILGPAPATLAKIRNQFRYQLLLKGPNSTSLNSFARQLISDGQWLRPGTRILTDVDPIHML
jgi:primosomal protein N' (replication factor Y) (superfamily II helicase)